MNLSCGLCQYCRFLREWLLIQGGLVHNRSVVAILCPLLPFGQQHLAPADKAQQMAHRPPALYQALVRGTFE